MKKILLILLLLFSINLYSQISIPTLPIREDIEIKQTPRNPKLSLTTSLFLNEIKKSIPEGSLIKKGSISYVPCIIVLNSTYIENSLSDLPILINSINDNIITALIPIDKFDTVSESSYIKYIDVGSSANKNLDNARVFTNVNQVQQGIGLSTSYNGNGVIIGVIDRGFDYTHPTFRDSNGNLRIKKVWEQSGTSGNSPAPFNYGTEYTDQNAILSRAKDIATESHGTHVTGIAAGFGTDGLNNTFKGMAPNSEIVLVSYNNLLGVTTNVQLLDNYFSQPKTIDAINYIINYANSVSKPVVINISQGTHLGPHDGSSPLDVVINGITNQGGKIIDGSAGNNGDSNLHISSQFTTISSKNYLIKNTECTPFNFIDIWGSSGTNFQVRFSIYNIITNTYANNSSSPYFSTSNTTGGTSTVPDSDGDNWSIFYAVGIENNKPHAIFFIDNFLDQLSDGDRFYFEITSANSTINAWCSTGNQSKIEFSNVFPNPVTNTNPVTYNNVENGNSNCTISEIGGTASGIISVGAYNTKACFYNFNSSPICPYLVDDLQKIAYFSSKGPTIDGRTKPDITAPGNYIVSSVNHFDTNYSLVGSQSNYVVSGTPNGYYAAMQGTSMAAPVVTGIIALWLQAFPNFTVSDIKTILQYRSITDNFTGTGTAIPNNTWGWGKIDALWGMQLIEQVLSKVVISQVYGGGGNMGATYSNDFIELYNSGTIPQNLNGWSVQYAAFNGPNGYWNTTSLPNFTLQPGQYFLIKCAAGGGAATALPLQDATSSTINLGGTAGKVILVNTTIPETTANPTGPQIIDKIGYGPTANGYEGSGPTAVLSSTTAAIRKLNGCTDTDSNPSDFTVGTPIPRNSASPLNLCSNLSISQNTLEAIKLYPNPTNSNVFFDNSNTNFKEVVVYNYLGQEVAREQLAGAIANQELNLSTLSAGVYVLKFHNGSATATAKVVKQ